jgi:hypothetical protein
MAIVVAFNGHTGIRIAEVGFLLIVFGGIWLAAMHVPRLGFARERGIVAGVAFALGGALLIVATHWGHFG